MAAASPVMAEASLAERLRLEKEPLLRPLPSKGSSSSNGKENSMLDCVCAAPHAPPDGGGDANDETLGDFDDLPAAEVPEMLGGLDDDEEDGDGGGGGGDGDGDGGSAAQVQVTPDTGTGGASMRHAGADAADIGVHQVQVLCDEEDSGEPPPAQLPRVGSLKS